jgi:hypothetical protein
MELVLTWKPDPMLTDVLRKLGGGPPEVCGQ